MFRPCMFFGQPDDGLHSCILYIATNCNTVVFMTVCIYRYTHTHNSFVLLTQHNGENTPYDSTESSSDLTVLISHCFLYIPRYKWSICLIVGRISVFHTGISPCAVSRALRYKPESRGFDFPMGSLKYYIVFILPATQWLCDNSAPDKNEYQGYLLGSKGSRRVGLTAFLSSCADCL
jgi:hypothetical protein